MTNWFKRSTTYAYFKRNLEDKPSSTSDDETSFIPNVEISSSISNVNELN